jgi:hypothetical protein
VVIDQMAMLWNGTDDTTTAAAGDLVSATLYIQNPSAPEVAGYEFIVVLPSNAYLANTTYLGDSPINIASPPEFACGLRSPTWPDTNGWLPLVELEFFITSPDQGDFYFAPWTHASIPGELVYVARSSLGTLRPMTPISGDLADPVARINGPDLGLWP